MEIQQKLKTEKQNKHRHRKLQGKLPEENSKDLFFFGNKKMAPKKKNYMVQCLRLRSAWIYVHNFLFRLPDIAPKWGRGANLCKTIKGCKAKGRAKIKRNRKTFKLLICKISRNSRNLNSENLINILFLIWCSVKEIHFKPKYLIASQWNSLSSFLSARAIN